VTTKKTVTSKPKPIEATTKKTGTKTVKKQVVKKTVVKKPVITRAEALQRIKGYNKKDLEQFRAIILEKRDEILEDLQSLKEQMLDTSTGEYINENSPYSLHMAEQGTDAMEREKTFLYAQRENKFLGYLDDALKRIDNGTYGVCIECVEEPQHLCETCPLVPKARLIAVPHTQHCLPIKQRKGGR
jgi:DnaK suppressor protein